MMGNLILAIGLTCFWLASWFTTKDVNHLIISQIWTVGAMILARLHDRTKR